VVQLVPDFSLSGTFGGAKQLYEAYKFIGLSLEDFEGSRYKRIDQVRYLIRTQRLDETLRWVDTAVPQSI
jgi:hypothetical protein